ncbi:50S ribosomal protein L33, partial [Dysosmobacter welbionis]
MLGLCVLHRLVYRLLRRVCRTAPRLRLLRRVRGAGAQIRLVLLELLGIIRRLRALYGHRDAVL